MTVSELADNVKCASIDPLFIPHNRSRPFGEAATDTPVFGQTLTSPPRRSFNTAAASPAVTDDPLCICVPPLANSTDPRTLASEANISPITACA
jgi:hypothetical protein